MSRFLFVVPPLAGHVYPASAVASQLAGRGHEVAWAGSPARLGALLGPGATVYPTGMRPHGGRSDTGMAAVKSLWEGFVVPFARFTLPAVDKAVISYQPDVVVTDQHALAGALVAHRHGLPWATMCTSSIELARPFAKLPKVDAWIRGHLARLCAESGLSGDEVPDLRFSPYLVIAFTSHALTGDVRFPDHYALVGPALAARQAGPDVSWRRLDPARRHLLMTVGTLAEDIAGDFYERTVRALEPLGDRLQAILVAPAGTVRDPPEHILVAQRVPVLTLMPRLDAVLCHGGMNIVCEALSYGVPLVVAPIRHDQPINAAQVAAVGAGIRIKFGRARPDQLREAVLAVLDEPGYAAAAGRVRDSFAAAGGAAAAAARLQRLARQPAS